MSESQAPQEDRLRRLARIGWDDSFAEACAEASRAATADADAEPARVAIEFNHIYRVWTGESEFEATVSGRLKHRAVRRSELPAVGDWVMVRRRRVEDHASIVAVLPRRSWFSRKTAGTVTDEQIVAANVDVVFLAMALDGDFSVRRLERYLLLARESGATPVVLLTKPDRSTMTAAQCADVRAVSGGAPVHVVNPKAGEGLAPVAAYLTYGRTGALLGSSGVGKSTLINRLVGEEVQKTREVRATDSKGRHTTMHRELVQLPSGGLIIDTPGMRELQLWDVEAAVRETFDDIEALADGCHFTNCRHSGEPRCAVTAASADGRLDPGRLDSYLRLQEELVGLARQRDVRAELDEKRRNRTAGRPPRRSIKLEP
ncbi:MAG: ribosome small subunit-dependent GTPase A [Acidobacteria bacterium]|nr:ribosome small subunit-dependent GTPase A [Acidobacteriota bacterium]